ncbi:hypothetical protein FACS189413_11340 [Bacteroidia bacterium]|nr:hypothetical protein FACS189463_3100 [Bacteroidia bacterium]GHU70680.1 hypothetical protein FACS189413_11340 [Bacteroidia bacterium]
MKIATKKSFSVSETEMGIKNVDIIYPTHLLSGKSNRLFLLCDGRSNRSMLAGQVVCDAVYTYFHSFSEEKITIDFIEKAIRMAEIQLSELQKEHSHKQGFSTSLSLFYLENDCAYLAQIGESSVCQIRDNQVIMKVMDVSFDRKICGVHNPVEINVVLLKDVQAGDYFFICNDTGISPDDEQVILDLMQQIPQTEECLSEIKRYYQHKYNKHFSGHLIPIEQIREPQTIKQWMDSLVYSLI